MSLIQRENRVGMTKGATWGTAAEPGTGAGLYVKAHTPPKGARKIVTNEDEFGRGMASEGQVLEFEAQSGSMSLRVYWEGLEPIIASLMGIYSSSEPEAGIVKHKFKMSPVMESLFHTVAWEEGDEIKAVNSARIISGNFTYADGLNLDVNYMGDKISVTGWSSPLGVTYPSEGKGIFKLSNAVVYINNDDGADFSDSDKLYPSGIDIAVTRGFEALPITAGSESIVEPIEKTAPAYEITLTFPKKEANTAAYLEAFTNRQYKKVKIQYEGDEIAGSAGSLKYELVFNFPKMFIMEAPDFAADSPIPTTIKLKALMASAAPTGMDEAVPYFTLQNKMAALTTYPS